MPSLSNRDAGSVIHALEALADEHPDEAEVDRLRELAERFATHNVILEPAGYQTTEEPKPSGETK